MTLEFTTSYCHKSDFTTVYILGLLLCFISDNMAAPSTRQYHLHSYGQETVQLSVEIHMVEDSTFMKDLLAS